MSNAAAAYARTAQQSTSPRDIEAQTLLMAARKLVEVQTDWKGPDKRMRDALLFNRRLWDHLHERGRRAMKIRSRSLSGRTS